jgi:hypothetical protein
MKLSRPICHNRYECQNLCILQIQKENLHPILTIICDELQVCLTLEELEGSGKKKHLPMKLLYTSSKHKVMGYSLFAIVKLW